MLLVKIVSVLSTSLFCVGFASEEKLAQGESKFLFTAPNTLTVNKSEKVLLNVFENPENEEFIIRLLLPDNTELYSYAIKNAETKVHDLSFTVPETDATSAILELAHGANKTLKANVKLFKEKSLMFIETDRPFYKPGELVRFRLLHLNSQLRPINKDIWKVWIENPSSVKMLQWKNVELNSGFTQLEMQLTNEPVKGSWKIKVQSENASDIVLKVFNVKEYVLPKFEVTIAPPGYISTGSNEDYTWKICAKYSFGAPVQGKVALAILFEEPNYWWNKKKGENSKMKEIKNSVLRKVDGCSEIILTSQEIAKYEKNHLQGIRVNATVKEEGTGEVQSASHYSEYHHSTWVKFDFSKSLKYYYPHIPYYMRVRANQPDGTAASNLHFEITVTDGLKKRETASFVSDDDGRLNFTIYTSDVGEELTVSLTCSPQQDNCKGVGRFTITPWFSPSSSHIMISGSDEAACNENYDLEVYYTFPKTLSGKTMEFFYLVQSKGEILNRGKFDIVLTKANQFDSDDALSKTFFKLEQTKNEISVGKWILKLNVKPNLAPEAKIVVYYVSNSEIVASSLKVDIKKCLQHTVHSEFSERRVEPGQKVTLSLIAGANSLCALSAVDKAVTFLDRNRALSVEKVFEKLEQIAAKPSEQYSEQDFMVERCSTEEDNSAIERQKRSSYMVPKIPFGNSKRAFLDGGMLVLSNLDNNIKPCQFGEIGENCDECPMWDYDWDAIHARSIDMADSDYRDLERRIPKRMKWRTLLLLPHSIVEPPPGKEEISDAVEMRTNFPETWLWQLEEISESGSKNIDLETPHTITDWILNTVCVSSDEGLGVAPETSVKVLKQYFMDFTLPYSVKRGETLPLKVSLFNYITHDLPITITFGQFSGGNLKGETIFSACLRSKDKLVHTFELEAKVLGEHNISVSAGINFNDSNCGPDVLVNARDAVTKTIKIKPEGFPVEVTKSLFLCLQDVGETAYLSWHLPVPENSVPDSAIGEVSVIGDLMGPSLENLDSLIRLPTGCGEQNMVLFVPNLVVLDYLGATDSLTQSTKSKAVANLVKGYQRELTYRHDDGSYSAFGKNDATGSMWLTAFVLKSFSQAKKFVFVDQNELQLSADWILKHQKENGCFRQIGSVFSKEMKGGVGSSSIVAFSSYIMIAILESKINIKKQVLESGIYCLTKTREETDVYANVVSAYALQLIRERIETTLTKKAAKDSLEHILTLVNSGKEGEIFWQNEGSSNLALKIETTAYAVLALISAGGEENMILAFNAVKWISKQRNGQGGFVSTQDTVLALEALAKYAMAVPFKDVQMKIQATTDDNNIFEFDINPENRQILHQNEIPYVPTNLHWTAEGKGCSLVQSTLRYNLKESTEVRKDAFTVGKKVSHIVPGSCKEIYLEFNMSYNLNDGASNMAVLEVEMISGYEPDKISLEEIKVHVPTFKRSDYEGGKVHLYFDSIDSSNPLNFGFVIVQRVRVENVKPAQIKLYDYYEQESFVQADYELNCNVVPGANQPNTIDQAADEPNSVNGNKLDDRFKDFKNVDFDLDFPDGDEGPVPVYVPAPNVP
ncbi:alpha-1-inhibitor 3-like [Neocloeon triangulifer]|uniref:alpha-1-inhibitor 3-like n=1 Tax=Neocloeon triangulifer TaxID=2078957 RepID=UPI00286F4B49|nr:alpha-1-inhibitor 3-like [Neocloeon triangulifer]